MSNRVFMGLVLLVTIPACCQSTIPAATGLGTTDDLGSTDQMLTPAPVSDQGYPTGIRSQQRSNFLRVGIGLNTAYSDNILGDLNANPVSDVEYSILPTIGIDKTTERQRWRLTYSPGFTFYQRTSSRNQTDQNVELDFQFRLSPHVTFNVQDVLLKTSNIFNHTDALSGEVIGTEAPVITFIGPVADVLSNTASTELTYQFRRNGMIGAEGTFVLRDYLKPAEVPGLYDSNASGGSGFYSHRLSQKHYIGARVEYTRILAYPVDAQSEVQTTAFMFFYTLYLKPTFSISLSGGPQHYNIFQSPLPVYGSWSPTFTASTGWQGRHTTLVGGYSRLVTGGGGLVGALQSNSGSVSLRRQVEKTWNVGVASSYTNNKNVTPATFLSSQGGHSFFGTFSVQHQVSEHFQLEFGYTRVQQTYSNVAVLARNPNTNREFINLTYQLRRPLGE
jgi:hypothetical protein